MGWFFQRGGACVLLFVGFLLQNIGITYTTASKSAFFTGTLVVLTPLVQFVIDQKVPRFGNFLGVLFAAIGLYLLTSPTGAEFNHGDGLTIISAVLFAVYIVYLGKVSDHYDRFTLMYSQIVVVLACSLIGLFSYETIKFEYATGLIVSLLYLTLLATLLTTWIQTRYQGDTVATRAAIIFTTEPVIAAICAYYVRDEKLGLIGLIGGAIIVAGLLVSELSDSIPWLNRALSPKSE